MLYMVAHEVATGFKGVKYLENISINYVSRAKVVTDSSEWQVKSHFIVPVIKCNYIQGTDDGFKETTVHLS